MSARKARATRFARLWPVALVAVVLLVFGIPALLRDGETRPPRVTPTSSATASKEIGTVHRVRLEGRPDALVVGEGAAWALILAGPDYELVRIDARTSEVQRLPAAKGTRSVAVGLGAVWASVCPQRKAERARLLRLEPATGAVVATIVLPTGEGIGCGSPVVVGDGSVWVETNRLLRIDPVSNRITAELTPCCILRAAAFGSLWGTIGFHFGAVMRIDPETGRVVARLPAPSGGAWKWAIGEGAVWVGGQGEGELFRIDPVSDRIMARVHYAEESLAVGAGYLWLVGAGPREAQMDRPTGEPKGTGRRSGIRVTRIDALTNSQVGPPLVIHYEPRPRFSLEGVPFGGFPAAVGEGALWIANTPDGQVIRVQLRSS